MTWEMTEIIGGEYVELKGNTHYYNYSCNDNYVLWLKFSQVKGTQSADAQWQ